MTILGISLLLMASRRVFSINWAFHLNYIPADELDITRLHQPSSNRRERLNVRW